MLLRHSRVAETFENLSEIYVSVYKYLYDSRVLICTL